MKPLFAIPSTGDWPTGVTALLQQLTEDGFTFHSIGDVNGPDAVVGSYYWDDYVDLVTITGHDQVLAARAVRTEEFNVFNPELVVWTFQNEEDPGLTLWALLHLRHPDLTTALPAPFPAPDGMRLGEHVRGPVVVKLPSLARLDRRATRLADEKQESK